MARKYFYTSLFFFCFTLNACAKAENTNMPAVSTKYDSSIFATSKSIADDQVIDINGDAQPDTVNVVTISKSMTNLPSSVTLITPWESNENEVKKPHSLAEGSLNNVFVTFDSSKQFLVHDVNDISLLDTEAASEISVASKSSLAELELSELSERAKGDVIVIPTEAGIDIYLYWNGSTFQTYEPIESP